MTYKKFKILISAFNIGLCIIITIAGFVILPKDLLLEIISSTDVAKTIPKIYVMLVTSIFVIGFCVLYYVTDSEWFLYFSLLCYASYIYFWTINS